MKSEELGSRTRIARISRIMTQEEKGFTVNGSGLKVHDYDAGGKVASEI